MVKKKEPQRGRKRVFEFPTRAIREKLIRRIKKDNPNQKIKFERT